MKKLVLLLAVAFSVSMFSCGKGEATNAVDSDSIKAAAQVEAAPEAPAADTVAAPAADTTATAAE